MSILKVSKLSDDEMAEWGCLLEAARVASEAKSKARCDISTFEMGLYASKGVHLEPSTTESRHSVIIKDGCAVFTKEHY